MTGSQRTPGGEPLPETGNSDTYRTGVPYLIIVEKATAGSVTATTENYTVPTGMLQHKRVQ
jgi:hypothetical protein